MYMGLDILGLQQLSLLSSPRPWSLPDELGRDIHPVDGEIFSANFELQGGEIRADCLLFRT